MGLKPISFHVVVVFGLGKDLLLKSVLGRCAEKAAVHACTKKLSGKQICCTTKWFLWKLDNLSHLYLIDRGSGSEGAPYTAKGRCCFVGLLLQQLTGCCLRSDLLWSDYSRRSSYWTYRGLLIYSLDGWCRWGWLLRSNLKIKWRPMH